MADGQVVEVQITEWKGAITDSIDAEKSRMSYGYAAFSHFRIAIWIREGGALARKRCFPRCKHQFATWFRRLPLRLGRLRLCAAAFPSRLDALPEWIHALPICIEWCLRGPAVATRESAGAKRR